MGVLLSVGEHSERGLFQTYKSQLILWMGFGRENKIYGYFRIFDPWVSGITMPLIILLFEGVDVQQIKTSRTQDLIRIHELSFDWDPRWMSIFTFSPCLLRFGGPHIIDWSVQTVSIQS